MELYEHCNRSVRLTISYSVICKFFIKGLLNCRLILYYICIYINNETLAEYK